MKTNTATNDFKFDFVGKVGIFGGISLILVIISLGYMMVKGIRYGIDFKGGTEVQVKFAQNVNIQEIRSAIEKQNIGDVGVQAFGADSEFIIRFQGKTGATDKETNEILLADIAKVKEVITGQFGAQQPEIRRVDSVGPQVGAELKKNGFLAVFYCLLVILIYVGLRFDYKYAPGAVICLAHDVIITLALYNFIGKEVNVPILAALLSLIGFSLNDTIVVFDRIRETESHEKAKGISYVINRAINDMFGRTIITSGTTFVSALCLFIFANGVVSDIALAICFGIFFGTYSSIYVAAPFILILDKFKGSKA